MVNESKLPIPDWYRKCPPTTQMGIVKAMLTDCGFGGTKFKTPPLPHGEPLCNEDGVLMLDLVLPDDSMEMYSYELSGPIVFTEPGWRITMRYFWGYLKKVVVKDRVWQMGNSEDEEYDLLGQIKPYRADWSTQPGLRWVRYNRRGDGHLFFGSARDVRHDAKEDGVTLATSTALLALIYWPDLISKELVGATRGSCFNLGVLANIKFGFWQRKTLEMNLRGDSVYLDSVLAKSNSMTNHSHPTIIALS